MNTTPFIAIEGRRYVPVSVLDAIVELVQNVKTDTIEYAASRTFGPADALLPAGQRAGLDDDEMAAVSAALPSCGYAGLLLREYTDWQVTRTQATQIKATKWFEPYADTVNLVARKIDPSTHRYGVFLVDASTFTEDVDA
jgi:hypothetical protein